MIAHPGNRKFEITGEELWQMCIWDEMQGGNKYFAHRKNQIYDRIVERENGK